VAAVPIRPEYGPTAGRLLEPRWRAASPVARALVICCIVAVVALAAALALRLQSASYSHGGRVPFSFKYKGLWRTAPDAGALVKLASREPGGAPKYSYEVFPLTLAPYSGSASGALPIYASGYVARLRAQVPGFVLRGEGKTRVNTVPGYQILFTQRSGARELYGRSVLLVPPREGAREGVIIAMLNWATADRSVKAPAEVASTGILLRPLKTFTFG
jgi:hypothetical protein